MPTKVTKKELKEITDLTRAQAIAAARSLDMAKIQTELAARKIVAPLSRDALGHLIEELTEAGYLKKTEKAYVLTEKARGLMKALS